MYYRKVFTIKIKTKLKIKELKNKFINKYYKFMQFIFKPFVKLSNKINKKKYKKKCEDSNYKPEKLKNKLYKSIQNILLDEECLFIYDSTVDYIPDDSGWNDMTVSYLFKKSNNKFLEDYSYNVRDKTITCDDWFEIIKGFNGNDIKVEEIDKDEAFKDMQWKEYDKLYQKSNRILRITKY